MKCEGVWSVRVCEVWGCVKCEGGEVWGVWSVRVCEVWGCVKCEGVWSVRVCEAPDSHSQETSRVLLIRARVTKVLPTFVLTLVLRIWGYMLVHWPDHGVPYSGKFSLRSLFSLFLLQRDSKRKINLDIRIAVADRKLLWYNENNTTKIRFQGLITKI